MYNCIHLYFYCKAVLRWIMIITSITGIFVAAVGIIGIFIAASGGLAAMDVNYNKKNINNCYLLIIIGFGTFIISQCVYHYCLDPEIRVDNDNDVLYVEADTVIRG